MSMQLWEILERRRPFEGLTQHAVQVRRRGPAPPGVCRMPPPGRSLHDHRRGVHCLASVCERHHAGLLAGSASGHPVSTLLLPTCRASSKGCATTTASFPVSILLFPRRPSGWQTLTPPACRPCACLRTWTRRASASTAAWRVGAGYRPCGAVLCWGVGLCCCCGRPSGPAHLPRPDRWVLATGRAVLAAITQHIRLGCCLLQRVRSFDEALCSCA